MSRYSKAIREKQWEKRQKEWNTPKLTEIKRKEEEAKKLDNGSVTSAMNDAASMNLSIDCMNITLM